MDKLFSKFQLGPLTLTNRMVMAPMTRNRAFGTVPNDLHVAYYTQRASAGLIVTEATQVTPEGVGYPNTPGIHTEQQAAAWREVTASVHSAGGRIFLQLWHVGRISHPSLQPGGQLPVAPSAVRPEGGTYTYQGFQEFVTPRALELEEIPGVVAQYAHGARLAKEAGFDGVEIHGANGYLIDQFLRDGTNHRTDAYGGTLQKRARFLLEVTEAVAGVWGADRVGLRLSPTSGFNSMSDSNPEATFTYAASALNRFGLAYLHIIDPVAESNRVAPALRAAFRNPFIVNGGYDRETGEAALAGGEADLVAYGVPFLANPDLPHRYRHNLELNAPDRATFYTGKDNGYIDYPAAAAAHA
ncbi:MAG: alkene reductase [Bryobacteraceae bacterium]|nr:alkene reductase [Bryobacteraceae bacterium]